MKKISRAIPGAACNAQMQMSRRVFVSGMLASPLAARYAAGAQGMAPMKIMRVETVYWK